MKMSNNKGQTLVTLLFFMVIAITITTGALMVIFINTQAQTKVQQSQTAYYITESGVENAIIRLLRDPTYTGETLTVGEGSVVIQVAGSGPYTITATGTDGNFTRKIQVVAAYTNNILSIQSWQEIF
jgi:hypothetical protein